MSTTRLVERSDVPNPLMRPMSKPSIYEHPFREAVIRAYVEGQPFSWTALCNEVESAPAGQTVHMGVYHYAKSLVSRGVITVQTSPNGGQQTSPRAYNRSPLALEGATLWHAVQPFMSDEALGAAAHKQVKDALRFVLAIERRGADALREACEAFPVSEMYGLPAKVIALGTAQPAPLARTTVASHESATRRLLRYAASRDLVPLVFPEFWGDSEWEELKARYLPLAGTPKERLAASRRRTAWNSFERASLALFSENPPSPLGMSRAQALDAVENIKASGEGQLADRVLGVLRHLAKTHRVGPLATEPEQFAGDRRGSGGKATTAEASDIYLRAEDGAAATASWEGMLDIIEAHGFPGSWREFLTYYLTFSTLSDEEMEAREDEFPLRTAIRELKADTLLGRMVAIRGLLGGAKQVLEDESSYFAQHGLTVADLHPIVVLAYGQKDIVRWLRAWWEQRAKVEPDRVSSALSKGIIDIVITLGQLAFSLYARQRHRHGQKVSTRATADGRTEYDLLHEEAAQKSPDEQLLYDAYLKALTTASTMRRKRAKRSRSGGKNSNTIKDIARLIEQVPPQFYGDALDQMHEAIQAMEIAGKGDGFRCHVLTADAFAIGLLASTACRISEATHTRLDIQFTAEHRAKGTVGWLADDRKNKTPHEGVLRERWLPRWLVDRFLTKSRPFLMRGQYQRKGKPELSRDHPWLLVNTKGDPYGHPWEIVTDDPAHPDNGVRPRVLDDEDDDEVAADPETLGESDSEGERSDEGPVKDPRERWSTELEAVQEWRRRKGILRGRFKQAVGRFAAKAGWRVPTHRYTLVPHGLRNVMGYVAFLHSLEEAMHLLGDGPAAILKAYSATSQAHIDNSRYGDPSLLESLVGKRPGPKAVGSPAAVAGDGSVANQHAYATTVQALVAGGLQGEALAATVEVLMRQYGIGGAPATVPPSGSPAPTSGRLAKVRRSNAA